MNFQLYPTRRHLFVIDWKSKAHTRLYLYANKVGISLSNNWGGQLENPIHIGFYWSDFRKLGLRWMWHRNGKTFSSLDRKR
jgi:hypothetical protein